jgi:putative endopeptidase
VLAVMNASIGFALGKIFVQKYFPQEAKEHMKLLVANLKTAFSERIKKLEWMEESTKQKALEKLAKMNIKIGYPDKWKSYDGLVLNSNNYFENILKIGRFNTQYEINKLGKAIDKDEWLMVPQEVNAYNFYNLNEIVFPAGILQDPFFSIKNTDAENYGAIGSIIGHEITHGFDDQGSKFNAKGNMHPWWTPQDRKRFEKKADVLVKQFNGYKVADGVSVNGKLTLGENIADLAGLAIAFDALQIRLKKTGRKILDGFTPEQRYFLGYAQSEQTIGRPEIEKMLAMVDPHSASEHRVNGPASDLESFYEAFNVQKGDKLYRDPARRAKIW